MHQSDEQINPNQKHRLQFVTKQCPLHSSRFKKSITNGESPPLTQSYSPPSPQHHQSAHRPSARAEAAGRTRQFLTQAFNPPILWSVSPTWVGPRAQDWVRRLRTTTARLVRVERMHGVALCDRHVINDVPGSICLACLQLNIIVVGGYWLGGDGWVEGGVEQSGVRMSEWLSLGWLGFAGD